VLGSEPIRLEHGDIIEVYLSKYKRCFVFESSPAQSGASSAKRDRKALAPLNNTMSSAAATSEKVEKPSPQKASQVLPQEPNRGNPLSERQDVVAPDELPESVEKVHSVPCGKRKHDLEDKENLESLVPLQSDPSDDKRQKIDGQPSPRLRIPVHLGHNTSPHADGMPLEHLVKVGAIASHTDPSPSHVSVPWEQKESEIPEAHCNEAVVSDQGYTVDKIDAEIASIDGTGGQLEHSGVVDGLLLFQNGMSHSEDHYEPGFCGPPKALNSSGNELLAPKNEKEAETLIQVDGSGVHRQNKEGGAVKTDQVDAFTIVPEKDRMVNLQLKVEENVELVTIKLLVVETVEPVHMNMIIEEKVEPVHMNMIIEEKVEPVHMNMIIEEKVEPVHMNMVIEEKVEPVHMNLVIEEKVENIPLHLNVVEKIEPVLLNMPVIEAVQPVKVNLSVVERVEKVNLVINVLGSSETPPCSGKMHEDMERNRLPSDHVMETGKTSSDIALEKDGTKKLLLKSKRKFKAARLGTRMAASQLRKALNQLHSTKKMLLSLTKKFSRQKFSKECLERIVQSHVQEIVKLQGELEGSHEVGQGTHNNVEEGKGKGREDLVEENKSSGPDLSQPGPADTQLAPNPMDAIEGCLQKFTYPTDVRNQKDCGCETSRSPNNSPDKHFPHSDESQGRIENTELQVGSQVMEFEGRHKFEAADNSPSTKSGIDSVDDACWVCGCCEEGEELLLCDQCDGIFHLQCVGLRHVPAGEWLCKSCKP